MTNSPSMVVLVVSIMFGLQAETQERQITPVSDARLATWILNGTQSVKEGALAHVLTIPAERRGRIIEEALTKELTRLNAERLAALVRARAAGVASEYEPGNERRDEYRADVTLAVSQSSDPAVIPALVGALGQGPFVNKGLAKFGAAAVDALVKAARAGHPDVHATAGALHALEDIVRGPSTLSRETRDKILTAAVERLSGTQHFVVAAAACDLGVATKDLALRNRVQQLANDAAQVAAMGISDQRGVAFVRDVANRALARKDK